MSEKFLKDFYTLLKENNASIEVDTEEIDYGDHQFTHIEMSIKVGHEQVYFTENNEITDDGLKKCYPHLTANKKQFSKNEVKAIRLAKHLTQTSLEMCDDSAADKFKKTIRALDSVLNKIG